MSPTGLFALPYSSQIQIVNDANGGAHAFLADNGLLWECQWNAEAERWDQGQVVPGAYGARDLQALAVNDLWPSSGATGAVPGNAPGIVLAYRLGNGASSQVMASFGAWGSDGNLRWSEAVPLSNTQGEDEAFALVPSAVGTLKVVLQKREPSASAQDLLTQFAQAPAAELDKALTDLATGARSDSDLYVSTLQINAIGNGGYAVQLSGNGHIQSTALTPATPAPAQASAAPAYGGNIQLSRAALAANAAPSDNTMLLGAGQQASPTLLGASNVSAPVGFNQQSTGQASGQGFGFSRYIQHPASLAGLALFPVHYSLGQQLAIADKKPEEDGKVVEDVYQQLTEPDSLLSESVRSIHNTESIATQCLLSSKNEVRVENFVEELVRRSNSEQNKGGGLMGLLGTAPLISRGHGAYQANSQ